MNKKRNTSYGQILKSSAIVGGAQALEIIIRMIRVKVAALLLGPQGVGLIGLFQSIIEFVGKFSNIGINSSAIRQVAESHGSGELKRVGVTVKVLLRACLVTGAFGLLITVIMSKLLSTWTFGTNERAAAIAFLGIAVLFTIYFQGQSAILQGTRRIKNLAQVMVLSAVVGTAMSIFLYAWIGERGIVPALICAAAINFAFSWWYVYRLNLPKSMMTWSQTAREAKPMITLGIAFMWAGILTTGNEFVIKSLVIRGFGIDGGGIYQAAWALSGLFAGFILNAMGKDFYPRLTAVAENNLSINRLVNEQIEVGVLIALPGLISTLAFSPWIINIFYSAEFVKSAEMLPWFVVGVFGRVVSWPMGFIILAKGASMTFAFTETVSNALRLLLVWLGLKYFGLLGAALAFAALYVCYTGLLCIVTLKISNFRFTRTTIKLICWSTFFIVLQFCIVEQTEGILNLALSIILVSVIGIYCLRQLIERLGPDHRISKTVTAIGEAFNRFRQRRPKRD